ncbi:TetR/AcrR family transcriptional regulator [Blastococcus montanus]|uniref:TetR/AcrR family transcriptional regulator n=1 Tax=Blastococcus montanus TaxID=3144973 RepID=UPI00320A5049
MAESGDPWVTTAPARRTQAERRASTREALVRATVESLVELGYARTTTQEVQRRAGVSRGALTHQFTSKAELVLAAVDHLYEEFSASVRQAAAELPAESSARIPLGVELVWQRFHGPLFVAAMELWTAARTDPELRAALLPHERRLGAQLRRLATEVFGQEIAAHPDAEALYQVLLTSMRGQAMTYALQPGAPRTGPHLQHWLAIVEAFTLRRV